MNSYPGYIDPAQAASEIVQYMKARNTNIVTKNEIWKYIEKNHLSNTLISDIAIALRDLYGIYPVSYEEIENNMDLIGELNYILSEDVDVSSAEATPIDDRFDDAIQQVFNNSSDEDDQLAVAALSMLPYQEVEDIACAWAFLSDHGLTQLAESYEKGGTFLAEQWLDLALRPHAWKFLSERARYELSSIGSNEEFFTESKYLEITERAAIAIPRSRTRLSRRRSAPSAPAPDWGARHIANVPHTTGWHHEPEPEPDLELEPSGTPLGRPSSRSSSGLELEPSDDKTSRVAEPFDVRHLVKQGLGHRIKAGGRAMIKGLAAMGRSIRGKPASSAQAFAPNDKATASSLPAAASSDKASAPSFNQSGTGRSPSPGEHPAVKDAMAKLGQKAGEVINTTEPVTPAASAGGAEPAASSGPSGGAPHISAGDILKYHLRSHFASRSHGLLGGLVNAHVNKHLGAVSDGEMAHGERMGKLMGHMKAQHDAVTSMQMNREKLKHMKAQNKMMRGFRM